MDFNKIAELKLFGGLPTDEIAAMAAALNFETRQYKKGAMVLTSGTHISRIGAVLTGSVRIESNDLWGNRSVLSLVKAGNVFAEAYALASERALMVDVVANEDCELLFFSAKALLSEEAQAAGAYKLLLMRLVLMCAEKNITLSERIFDSSSKTIRGRLISFLSREAARSGSYSVAIQFDRQQLADYLGVERSALSKELSKMRADGMLEYRKNRFELKPGEFDDKT